MSPSITPSSMKAVITSVYRVMPVCTLRNVASRSLTLCEIATFMKVVSSNMMNWVEASIASGIHLRMVRSLGNDCGRRRFGGRRGPLQQLAPFSQDAMDGCGADDRFARRREPLRVQDEGA